MTKYFVEDLDYPNLSKGILADTIKGAITKFALETQLDCDTTVKVNNRTYKVKPIFFYEIK